jgi:hypothetical protein
VVGEPVHHHCLNVLYFGVIGELVDHHCLNFLCFVLIDEIVDHHCLNFLCFAKKVKTVMVTKFTNNNKTKKV